MGRGDAARAPPAHERGSELPVKRGLAGIRADEPRSVGDAAVHAQLRRQRAPPFTPGSNYEYSNSDNLLIGLMDEAVTGRPYGGLLRELVYSPLKLKQTSLPSKV